MVAQLKAVPDNPYLTREQLTAVFGQERQRAQRNWWVAFALAIALNAAVGGMIWQSTRSRIIPYVAVADERGRTLWSGVAGEATAKDLDRIKRATIQMLIEDVRAVSTDAQVEERYVTRAYSHFAAGSAARKFFDEHFQEHNPYARGKSEGVTVDHCNVLPVGDKSYEVEWAETTRDLYGTIKSTEKWKASLGVAISPPTEEAVMRLNPLGLFITQASWTKVL